MSAKRFAAHGCVLAGWLLAACGASEGNPAQPLDASAGGTSDGGGGVSGSLGGTGGKDAGKDGSSGKDAGLGGSAGSDASAGSAGTGGASGTGGAGTAGSGGGSAGGGTAGAAGAGVCTPGLRQCLGLTPQLCDNAGQWVNGQVCDYVCSGGECKGSCKPGTKQCIGSTPQLCDNSGSWQSGAACQYVCSEGDCGICAPGSVQCAGLVPQTCNAKGQWEGATPCPFTCTAGVCAKCSAGTYDCAGGVSKVCDANGQWQDTPACQNPSCTGKTACVDIAPSGWYGPVALYEGSPIGIPSCSAPFSGTALTLFKSPVQAPAQCSPCSCTNFAPGCLFSTLYVSQSDPSCAHATSFNMATGTSFCTVFTNGIQYASTAATDGLYGTYKVDASGGTTTLPTIGWQDAAQVCTLPYPAAAGCSGGQVCSPVPVAPFNGKTCVYQNGDLPCPSSFYASKRLYYSKASDGRGCSQCGCTCTKPTCSNGSMILYSTNQCTGTQVGTLSLANACVSTTADSAKLNATMSGGGNCNANGGQPTGTIDQTDPVTICCTP